MDSSILNAFFTLLLIVALIGFLTFILKKTTKNKNFKDEFTEMKVLSKMALNQKNHLYIVQIANKRLLLGVSENNINTLSEFDINHSNEKIELKLNQNKKITLEESLSFKSFLKSTFSNQKN